jgi:hypothetical protein
MVQWAGEAWCGGSEMRRVAVQVDKEGTVAWSIEEAWPQRG